MFLAGLLQDIGILALDRAEPNLYAELPADATLDETLAYERARLGEEHAGISSWLLRAWNLPEALCQAVALSHTPERADASSELGQTCRCIALSNDVADVFLVSERRSALERMTSKARILVGLSPEQISGVVGSITRLMPDVEAIFDAHILAPDTAAEIAAEAQELLAERSLTSA